MKVWLDTEFHEQCNFIELISIGMIREDEKTFYAENDDYDRTKANQWLRENVIKNLKPVGIRREFIRKGIIDFLADIEPEFWAWYGGYDWVVLCQLFGGLFGFPDNYPLFFNEVQQLFEGRGTPVLELKNEHHALSDAIYSKHLYEKAMEGKYATFER